MHYAINLLTHKVVVATDPNVRRHTEYICPVCRSPVHLRRGLYKVPYFAHNSGGAKPSCELYSYNDSLDSLRDKLDPSYRSLGVYLKIIERGQQSPDWRLEIGIPEPDTHIGRIMIPFSLDGVRTLPTFSIKHGGIRIPIRPAIGPFQIHTENVPEGKWKSRISQSISGLDINSINIFRYSPYGGRRLLPGQDLYWGRSYVVVCDNNNVTRYGLNKNVINTKELEGKGLWRGFLIQLPTDYNEEVEIWIKKYLDKIVIHPPAELRLISPLPERQLPDGSYIINEGCNVVLGINGESGTKKWKQIYYKNSDESPPFLLKGQGVIPSIVKLTLQPGRNEIWLDEDVYESMQIFVEKRDLKLPKIPEIKINGEDSTKRQFSIGLHTEVAENIFRDDRINITGIKIPRYISLDIKWRDSNLTDWNLYKIKAFECLKDKESKDIVSLLNKKNIIIEAGLWGHVTLDGDVESREEVLDMGSEWRTRAVFLLNLLPTLSKNTKITYNLTGDFSNMSSNDQVILKKIALQKHWPKILSPHLNVLLDEYQKVIKK
jgi:hypothetical protein